MATTMKLIKTKAFQANGQDATHHVVAYKGRVFGVNSLRFEANDFKVDEKAKTLTLNVECEIIKRTESNLGETTTYLDIVPKLDLALSEI